MHVTEGHALGDQAQFDRSRVAPPTDLMPADVIRAVVMLDEGFGCLNRNMDGLESDVGEEGGVLAGRIAEVVDHPVDQERRRVEIVR